jgi:glycine/D-amino acid oxidase-like deaminating enzyme/nitrite reductase/ring-hydroxylating ferredoxin subunit
MGSLWLDPPLTMDSDALVAGGRHDVVVVGAGLTGLATAVLLAEAGRSVLVLEGDEVGHGTTGHTTGKVSLLQGTVLSGIRRHATEAEISAYVTANQAGQEWLLEFLGGAGARVELRDAWTYAVSAQGRERVIRELDVARAVGLAVEESAETELPFPVSGAIRLPGQAQVHAGEMLRLLAQALRAGGGTLVTGARVTGVSAGSPPVVTIRWAVAGSIVGEDVEVSADRVVLATGSPIVDRALHFARLEPQRSYALAFRVPGPLPGGMYLSAEQPSRSLRTVTVDGETLLLVGGEGHVVGRGGPTQPRVDRLGAWARAHFPGAEQTHRWSAQDYRSTRRLPLVGPLPGSDESIVVATGFAKWGLTNATAAALSIAGRVTGEVPPWSDELYGHIEGLTDLADAAKLNAAVAAELARGWGAGMMKQGPAARPPEGQGIVGRQGRGPVAVSTVDGSTCAVSAVCTHLGGVLSWNDAERTWDCPLHGSRFAPDGRRLEGPATSDLRQASRDAEPTPGATP